MNNISRKQSKTFSLKNYPGLLSQLQLPLLIFFSLIFISCTARPPVITSIYPKIGNMGDVITLRGHNFGHERQDSFVTIAGVAPTSSSYFTWQDEMIMVRVPETGSSGLVFIHAGGRRSNGVLFSDITAVPRPVEGEVFGLEPRITSVNPQTGIPGTLITIQGSNFGASRNDALGLTGVFFSWEFDAPINPFAIREPQFIEVSNIELGYETWGTREIRVRVPDGAVSGNMFVRTVHGESRPVLFDVSGKPGFKNFRDKRSFTFNYSVDIRVLEATRPNSLYLWMPMPITSSSQRNVQLVSRSKTPFIENHRGVKLFKLENLAPGSNHTVNISFNVEVYAVETGLRPVSIRQINTPLSTIHTQSSALIPSDDPQIRAMVNTITGREQNPFVRARMIYDWILNNVQITEAAPAVTANVVAALEQRQSDSYNAALLFTAMARAARIPAIPVAGVLINRGGQTLRHYWAEFWIDDFGWIPVDPAMGAGAPPPSFITIEDTVNYYFGNLDSNRIAFSRGELILSQIERHGRIVSHSRSFSLQNIWEEAVGGLEAYSSLWSDIIITGMYTH